jgi:hypothetical protein
VPRREPARSAEIRCRRRHLPLDLRDDLAFTVDSDQWHTWQDRRRQASFLGDRDFPWELPPPPRHRTVQPPTQDDDEEDDYDAMAYHNEQAKNDSDDFVSCIFHEWKAATAEGHEFNLPQAMADKEIEKLGVLVLRVDQAVQTPLPRYATDIMPQGLTEEEAL